MQRQRELRKVGYRSDSDKKEITWRLLRATMKQAEEAVSACPYYPLP